tara:strand:+ start:488 stop:997 length:510 start_codon:yes stop_codon:yes gene_type:complete
MDSENIFIIGAMGSGKSSIGKLLAEKTGRQFIDTDKEIEKNSKYDISTIFREYGEKCFRTKETTALLKLDQVKNHIIATGGGIILEQVNINFMKEMGLIIFLDISLKAQIKRVKYRRHRPLLKSYNLEEKLKVLKNERDAIYNKIADYIIDVSEKDKNTVVNEIENKLL